MRKLLLIIGLVNYWAFSSNVVGQDQIEIAPKKALKGTNTDLMIRVSNSSSVISVLVNNQPIGGLTIITPTLLAGSMSGSLTESEGTENVTAGQASTQVVVVRPPPDELIHTVELQLIDVIRLTRHEFESIVERLNGALASASTNNERMKAIAEGTKEVDAVSDASRKVMLTVKHDAVSTIQNQRSSGEIDVMTAEMLTRGVEFEAADMFP